MQDVHLWGGFVGGGGLSDYRVILLIYPSLSLYIFICESEYVTFIYLFIILLIVSHLFQEKSSLFDSLFDHLIWFFSIREGFLDLAFFGGPCHAMH